MLNNLTKIITELRYKPKDVSVQNPPLLTNTLYCPNSRVKLTDEGSTAPYTDEGLISVNLEQNSTG